MIRMVAIPAILLLTGWAAFCHAAETDKAPPAIVSTNPPANATDVDPATSEIVVVFDQDMADGFSWTGGGPEFPAPAEGKKPHWRNARTAVLPVKLEAGRYYRIGINSKSHRNFRSIAGLPGLPAVICFITQGAGEKEVAKLQKPVIEKMIPAHGARKVDAATTELRITFSIPMGRGFSWTGGGPDFPPVPEGQKATWSEDQRTCILPVRLAPRHRYRLGLNSPSHRNFQSAAGVPLEPVVYAFETGN